MSSEKTLRKWLPAKTQKMQTRKAIYDFDGTLFRSPDRDEGEILYLEGTGKIWPFAGWWGRPETLLPPIVPDPPPETMFIKETVEAYRKDYADPNCSTILMTGRPYKAKKAVEAILASHNLVFDHYYYRGMKGQRGSDTFEIKINIIEAELLRPETEILEIWEDRPEHASGFMTKAKYWKSKCRNHLRQVIVHDVPSGLAHVF